MNAHTPMRTDDAIAHAALTYAARQAALYAHWLQTKGRTDEALGAWGVVTQMMDTLAQIEGAR